MTRTARCCCGNSSLTVDGDPVLNGICNCDNCKARTGSALGWNAYFKDDQIIQKSGIFNELSLTKPCLQTRYFCRTCGTTLFWKSAWMADCTGTAGGCFIDPPLPEPAGVYATKQACDWLTFPDAWPRIS